MNPAARLLLIELAAEAVKHRDLHDRQRATRATELAAVREARSNRPLPAATTRREVWDAEGWSVVAERVNHNRAYSIRRKWLGDGFEARIQIQPDGFHSVLARAKP